MFLLFLYAFILCLNVGLPFKKVPEEVLHPFIHFFRNSGRNINQLISEVGGFSTIVIGNPTIEIIYYLLD